MEEERGAVDDECAMKSLDRRAGLLDEEELLFEERDTREGFADEQEPDEMRRCLGSGKIQKSKSSVAQPNNASRMAGRRTKWSVAV